jgi:CRISPR/Cas system-associated exonuclease Cas4 (RecB family)
MEAFLLQVAGHLKDHYAQNFQKTAVVFPNRRAGIFLRKHMSGLFTEPIWFPTCFSIEDFVFSIIRKDIAENEELLVEMFLIHQQLRPSGSQSFDDFIDWASAALEDFEEIDHYLADATAIFTYLTDSKAISLWSPEKNTLTDFEKQYLEFYRSLIDYYTGLKEALGGKKKATKGMAYREFAENIDLYIALIPWEKVVFAGFNAMTKAEEVIINSLVKAGKAEILWDADNYYFLDEMQEAGSFLRDAMKNVDISKVNWISDNFRTSHKHIAILGVAKNIGQVKAAGQIIEDLVKAGEDLSETALVLGKEDMLMPMLNSLPDDIENMNVTMGLPLSKVSLHQLFEIVFNLHILSSKYNNRFYYRNLVDLFQHPIIKTFDTQNNGNGNSIAAKLKTLKKIYYTKEELKEVIFHDHSDFHTLIGFIFDEPASPNDFIVKCQKIIGLLKDMKKFHKSDDKTGDVSSGSLEKEFLFQFSILFARLRSFFEEYPIEMELKSLFKFYNQAVQVTKIPFFGEPLKGLQIMGMLETRNLDFRNVIILNVNEDIIPSGGKLQGYIPFDIRKEFGLPTFSEKQAVAAYHFYRLLQRPDRIFLLYNTEAGNLSGGDKSRFILQIQNELKKYNPKIEIEERVLTAPSYEQEQINPILVPKSDAIIDVLMKKAEKGFSPTALNKYRKCSLQFYFSEIASIRELEEITETIDAQTLGTSIHKVLENLFSEILPGNILTQELIKGMLPRVSDLLFHSFTTYFPQGDLHTGKSLLLSEVSKRLIERFLSNEINRVRDLEEQNAIVRIFGTEYAIRFPLKLKDNTEVYLHGLVDRIDQIGNNYLIIDYKTGSVNKTDLRFSDWDDLATETKLDKCFQLLFYCFVFAKQNNLKNGVEAAIISFRQLNSGYIFLETPDGKELTESSLQKFEALISELLEEIFDKEKPFQQTADSSICEKCPYLPICNKSTN